MAEQGAEGLTHARRPDAGEREGVHPPARFLRPPAEEIAGRSWTRPWRPAILAGLVAALEFLLLGGAGLAVHLLQEQPAGSLALRAVVAVAAAIGTLVAIQAGRGYELPALRRPAEHLPRIAASWSAVFLAVVVAAAVAGSHGAADRAWFVALYAAGITLLVAGRLLLAPLVHQFAASGRFDRLAVIVGGGPGATALLRALAAQGESEVRVCGFFDDRDDERSPNAIGRCPKLGTTDDVPEFVRRVPVDLILFALPVTAEERILAMLRKLWVLPVDIRLAAHQSRLCLRTRACSHVAGVPMLSLADRPLADWDAVMKWLFDKVVGGFLLMITAPVLLALAMAVKLDSPGPVLTRQRHYGFNNEPIDVLKFRIHRADRDGDAQDSAVRDRPRDMTRVGQFLRRTALDELPQLVDVVVFGTLSLVGPRPHPVDASAYRRRYEEIVDGYFARHRVKPGLTGWAQIAGLRDDADTPETLQKRVEHDLYYIENWSPLLDLYILLSTPLAFARSEQPV